MRNSSPPFPSAASSEAWASVREPGCCWSMNSRACRRAKRRICSRRSTGTRAASAFPFRSMMNSSCRRATRFSMSPIRCRTSIVDTLSAMCNSINYYSCDRCYRQRASGRATSGLSGGDFSAKVIDALLKHPTRLLEGTSKRERHVKLRPGCQVDSRSVPFVGRPTITLRARSNSVVRPGAVGDESSPSCALVRRRSAYSPALDDSVRDDSARQTHAPLAENGVRPAE